MKKKIFAGIAFSAAILCCACQREQEAGSAGAEEGLKQLHTVDNNALDAHSICAGSGWIAYIDPEGAVCITDGTETKREEDLTAKQIFALSDDTFALVDQNADIRLYMVGISDENEIIVSEDGSDYERLAEEAEQWQVTHYYTCLSELSGLGDVVQLSFEKRSSGYTAICADGLRYYIADAEKQLSDDGGWQDMAECALYNGYIIGLSESGTVSSNIPDADILSEYALIPDKLAAWEAVIDIECEDYAGIYALTESGNVYTTSAEHAKTAEWTQIVQISADGNFVAARNEAGEVLVSCANIETETKNRILAELSEWTQIEMVKVTEQYIIGLAQDGRLRICRL